MRPELPPLLLLLLSISISSSLLHPAASHCVRRTSLHPLSHTHLGQAPAACPTATQLTSPAPVHSPLPPPATAPTSTNSAPSDMDGVVEGLVKSVCGHTDYPDVCLSSIQSLLPTLRHANPASILSLQIKAQRSLTVTVRALASHLSTAPKTDPQDKDSYRTVLEFYDDALDNLDASTKALAVNDKGTLNSMLSALIDNYSDVEDEVGGSDKPSPLSAHDDVLRKMTSNSLAIATLF